ncbi:hypothetical protein [Arachidicoccus ginsenosidimutans]|uniref:hypothetical protein n=1 Tax=Arachidicoccus sp. BS20 TaxID=1850526 RepID=UPI0018D34639|nr:hypothetical protein [Arachidicoccus sp. BS20]
MTMTLVITKAQQKTTPNNDSIPKVDSTIFVRRMFFKNPLANYNYYNQMGIMCKAEYKMQHAIKIPLCFRVGSLEECKKMETIPQKFSYEQHSAVR